ncbi:hypothetical protein D1007_28901 [Hordeum vulgare]|nr:hypothetical protein D1007_28901 [Hordeum vulgare]KAI4997914.1 hypothetical protein ZWY2020_053256 [Hordeum vulgare]
MAHRISSTPCDASGCEATEEAPLLDVEKGVPEERATASPADDGAAETTASRRFWQGFLAGVWLCMVNQMRIQCSACEDGETRAYMAFYMGLIALNVGTVFHIVGTQPAYPPAAQSTSVPH